MQVDIDEKGSFHSTFLFTCHGMSSKSTQVELVRGRYRPVADVCQGGQIRVAFNYRKTFFYARDDKMWYGDDVYWSILFGAAFPQEILTTFFNEHKLTPIFIDNYGDYGWWLEEEGRWSGAVGMVRANIVLGI